MFAAGGVLFVYGAAAAIRTFTYFYHYVARPPSGLPAQNARPEDDTDLKVIITMIQVFQ